MRAHQLGLAVLPFLPLACFGSGSSGGAGPGFDAGNPDVTIEGSTDDGSTDGPATTDGPMDAMAEAMATTDAPTTDVQQDAPAQPVTMKVSTPTGPESGVTVVFGDATGNVLGTVMTDANGSASLVAPAGSQVTVLLGSQASPQIVTITGVAPGDMLAALDTTGVAAPTVSVDAVPGSPPMTTTNYTAYAGSCSTGFLTAPSTLLLQPGCQSGGQFPLLVVAQNASYIPLGFVFQNGNAITTDDAGLAHVAITTGMWTALPTALTQTVAVTNGAGASGTLAFSELAGGVPMQTTIALPAADDAGVQGSTFPVHTGYPDAVQAEVNVLDTAVMGSGASFQAIATHGPKPTASGTTTLDLSTALPNIVNATIDSTHPGQPSMTWTGASSLAGADGAVAQFAWSGVNDAGMGVNGTWTVYAPATVTTVTVPTLPAAASSWAPPATASFQLPEVEVVKATFLTQGYAQLRTQPSSFPIPVLNTTGISIVPPLPADGTLLLTTYGPNPS